MSSTTVSARALYSDSVEERETVRCFLAVQEIKFDPRYMANPPWIDDHPGSLPSRHLRRLKERMERQWSLASEHP